MRWLILAVLFGLGSILVMAPAASAQEWCGDCLQSECGPDGHAMTLDPQGERGQAHSNCGYPLNQTACVDFHPPCAEEQEDMQALHEAVEGRDVHGILAAMSRVDGKVRTDVESRALILLDCARLHPMEELSVPGETWAELMVAMGSE